MVDDEPDLLELVRFNLAQAGYRVSTALTGNDGLTLARTHRPDLIVLDVMLPDISGTEVCRRMRADPHIAGTPILMLTAKSEEIDRVISFELGADDYVTKPFSPRELILRVRAILRRSADDRGAKKALERGGIRIDQERHRCWAGERVVTLTSKEFQILASLMNRVGYVKTRSSLLDEVWGSDVSVTTRTVDTHMKRLREKLGDEGRSIETVRGVGYRFTE